MFVVTAGIGLFDGDPQTLVESGAQPAQMQMIDSGIGRHPDRKRVCKGVFDIVANKLVIPFFTTPPAAGDERGDFGIRLSIIR